MPTITKIKDGKVIKETLKVKKGKLIKSTEEEETNNRMTGWCNDRFNTYGKPNTYRFLFRPTGRNDEKTRNNRVLKKF